MRRTVIIGGGISGLVTAYELSKGGMVPLVLEKEAQVGGLGRTIVVGEFFFDLGGHRWYMEDAELNDFFKGVCGERLIEVPRTTRIYFQGQFFRLPIRVREILSFFGSWVALRCVLHYLVARITRLFVRPSQETIEDAYIGQFGRILYRLFFKRYTEKFWGMSCRNLSAEWVNVRAKGLDLATTIRGIFLETSDIESIDTFLYPEEGMGQFPERMAEEIRSRGGEIRCSSKVVRLNRTGGKIASLELAWREDRSIRS